MPSLPPSLSEISAKLGGMGRGEDGGRVAFGKLAGKGWGGAGSAQAGQCRHWLLPLHSAICLASLPTPFLSLSLHPQQNEKRKTGSSFCPPPTSTRPPLLLPTTHHTTPPPSHLCSRLLVPFFHSPSPSHQNGCNVLKYIHLYIFKSNLEEKLFSLGMSCPSESGSSVPMFMAGRGRGPCPQLVPMNPMPGRRGGWGGVGVGWGVGRALFSLRLWWLLFFPLLPLPEQIQIDLEPSPPPVLRAPVHFSPCF